MCQKLLYQHQNWSSPCIWRDMSLCHLNKVFLAKCVPVKLICLLVLNLKMLITKVTEVLFGPPKEYMLQNLKMTPLSIKSSKPQLSCK